MIYFPENLHNSITKKYVKIIKNIYFPKN
jgi:hypothetical protein